MELHEIDMNLLATLDVLLRERSVSNAARRLGRSQSAVSHALQRLRDQLDDPVLVRQGHGMVASPRAEQLQEPLHELLGELAALLARPAAFDPAASTRRFVVSAPDVLAVPLPELLAAIQAEAPQVQVELVQPGPPERLARHVDLALAPLPESGASLRIRRLGTVQNAVVMRRGHPRIRTMADYLAWPHTFVRTATQDKSLVGQLIAQAGHTRTLGTVVPGFVQALLVVSRTDEIFTCPGAVVRPMTELFGLEVVPCPLPMPQVPVVAMWHARRDADAGHAWFRERVADTLKSYLAVT